jgi:rare lipoprotein A
MRKFILVCAAFIGFTSATLAAEQGIASYYQNTHYRGLIGAHKTLPLGALVRVLNLDNGRSAIVRIVDRGPFIRGRIIDVSLSTATALGFRQAGTAHVRIERI